MKSKKAERVNRQRSPEAQRKAEERLNQWRGVSADLKEATENILEHFPKALEKRLERAIARSDISKVVEYTSRLVGHHGVVDSLEREERTQRETLRKTSDAAVARRKNKRRPENAAIWSAAERLKREHPERRPSKEMVAHEACLGVMDNQKLSGKISKACRRAIDEFWT